MELLQQDMQKLTLEVNRSLQAQRQQSSTPLPPGFAQRLNDLESSFGQNCQKLENLEAELASVFHLFCEFRNEKKPDLPATASIDPVNKVNNTLVPIDGTLVWKIDDFASKRQDAIDGRKRFIPSPVFLTSQNGYKLSARVYLNGDGMGKGTHISLFLVVMRGECDALLNWPFSRMVTFKIHDQNRVADVQDTFLPKKGSSSFRRPKSECNIASGCPLFMALNSLNDRRYAYVKDDTMFIEVTVGDTDQSPQDSQQGRIN
ncbi:MATH domain-containing protein [Endozoicomonas sp. ONNA2]|uniref:MATH domain-containing protein n=1 Tax=Endozoicomonas sp. ONNA2 TaxID=2828741 RepID=UPI0021491E2C|nr:MATH domain-containing protein [Endozoicomonas sp. ONNA2]